MIGQMILHYNILEKLGEGGMGVVYLAEDTRLERKVAIKFLPRNIAASMEDRQRFEIEAKAAAALNHPNIATIHAIEEADKDAFIVMEYIDGQELQEWIARNVGAKHSWQQSEFKSTDLARNASPLPFDDIITIAMQIASGLQAAHEKGVVHRDIKSANIMVTHKNQIKIMDFGLAKVAGSDIRLTKKSTTLGTAAYMSPEQTQGAESDHRTDIWAFGVVLYEMLTGQLPFRGEYEQAVIYSILNEDPTPISEFRDDVPEELSVIVTKALKKDAHARYQDPSELLEALRELGNKPLAASFSKRSTTTTSKRPIPHAVVAGILILLLAGIFYFGLQTEPDARLDSIAVLPLKNLSGDPNQEYFSDGMTEALIMDLSKIGALKVTSRTTVMQYKNANKPLPDIAKELDVKAVIEGSVLRDGNRVRITAQLIEAESDRHLWAESYERNLTDIFALQHDIAQDIARQVKIILTPGEQQQLQDFQQIDPNAYEAYLKGTHHAMQYVMSDLLKSLDYFSQAVKIEPDFALAQVGIVRACVGLIDVGGLPYSELYPKAKSALEKALQLDNSLAEVYSVKGRFKLFAEWDWTGAEKAFRKSLELNANLASAYHDYALFLTMMDRREEAHTMITKARSLDPMNPFISNDVAWVLYYARRYDEAIQEYHNNLEVHPNWVMSHRELSWAYTMKSRFEEAIQSAQRAIALEPSVSNHANLACTYALAGQKERAHDILNDLLSTRQTQYISAYDFAGIYLSLGDFDEAFKWLEISYQNHSGELVYIKAFPDYEPLYSDPRWAALLEKVGLAP